MTKKAKKLPEVIDEQTVASTSDPAPERAGKASTNGDPTASILFPLRLALILCAITASVALLLAVINEFTDSVIAEQEAEATDEAMRTVLPGWDHYDATLFESTADDPVSNVYVALDADNYVLGYCVLVSPTGFGGEIKMMVGFEAGDQPGASEYKVSGIEFISMNETPGLGTKVKDDFAKALVGKLSSMKVVKSKAADETEIQAVTAATISSKAVVSGINAAANAVMQVEISENYEYERRSAGESE